jgi:hypothetical protein
LPSALTTEWKKMLSQPRITPEVELQIEQGKQIITQLTAEVQRLKMDQSAKMEALKADWQKSMAALQMEAQNTERELALKREVASIDAQLEAEKAAADIILQRAKWISDWQLKMAEASANADIEAMKMQAEAVRTESDAMRSKAESDIAEMVKKLDNVIAMPRRGGKGKGRKRSVSIERDVAGRILGALIEAEGESGPVRERVAVRRGANGRIAGAEIEELED